MRARTGLAVAVPLLVGAALAAHFTSKQRRELAEIARLYSRSRACLVGDAPVPDMPAHLRAIARAQAALGPTKMPWPGRCQSHLKALAESALAERRAAGLVLDTQRALGALERGEDFWPILEAMDRAASARGIVIVPVESDVLPPPTPMLPQAQLVGLTAAPRGTRVTLDTEAGPAIRVGPSSDRSCRPDDAWRTIRCDQPSPKPPLALALLSPKGPGSPLEPKLMVREGPELALPELHGREPWQMRIAGDWLLWVDGSRGVRARRFDAGPRSLAAPVQIAGSASGVSFVDGCRRAAGPVVVLGRPGEPAHSSHDTALVLFEDGGVWKSVSAADVRLFHDPDPVYRRARVSCDQAGVWLTWSSREAGLHFVRCTPSGCRAGSWAIPGISAESAHVAELGDKVFLVASRLAPSSAIVLRTGAIDRMASAAERCIAEGAWAAASLAQRDVMLVVARGDDAAGKVGAFRVDVSERVESLIAAP
ncbi:MAG: hypothetical protein L6Q84_19955 [Polyangiaceae bacterium]|nr:hypothetical protein [Polyangiaceae bacterium]